jgi:hypothetical protein
MMNVQQALRRELGTLGFDVADDTVASRGAIYVKGDGDLAAGLFEFKQTAIEAMDSMYQGHWIEGLPPRFAVLPADATQDSHFELLEQARIIPLLYQVDGDEVSFIELESAVARLGA